MKTLKAFFLSLVFSLQISFTICKFTIKYLFDDIPNIFQNLHVFNENIFFFFLLKKCLSSSKFLLYIIICEQNMHTGLFFFKTFLTNEIFKILFTKQKLIRYYYFINIYIVYRNFYSSVSVAPNFITFLFILIYGFNLFCNFSNL